MKVILREDVKGKGNAGDVIDVKTGFARTTWSGDLRISPPIRISRCTKAKNTPRRNAVSSSMRKPRRKRSKSRKFLSRQWSRSVRMIVFSVRLPPIPSRSFLPRRVMNSITERYFSKSPSRNSAYSSRCESCPGCRCEGENLGRQGIKVGTIHRSAMQEVICLHGETRNECGDRVHD